MKHYTEVACAIDMAPYADFYKKIVQRVATTWAGRTYVEAGVRAGCSARIIRDALWAFDTWELYLIDPEPTEEAEELDEDPRVILIKQPAEQVASLMFQNHSIDFLHIDADIGGSHEYWLSKGIFDAFLPKLCLDAYVIFHDCTEEFPGIVKLVNEIKETGWEAEYCPPADECPIAAPVALQRKVQ